MHALRDRISEKLSRLFSDSPTHVVDHHPQARSYSSDRKSLSSAFPFILPSVSLDRSTSNTNVDDTKPIQSLSYNWRSKTFSWQDKPWTDTQNLIKKTKIKQLRVIMKKMDLLGTQPMSQRNCHILIWKMENQTLQEAIWWF